MARGGIPSRYAARARTSNADPTVRAVSASPSLTDRCRFCTLLGGRFGFRRFAGCSGRHDPRSCCVSLTSGCIPQPTMASSSAGRKGAEMGVRAVSPALAGRLGADATAGLVELIDTAEGHCMDIVMERSVERFERRLSEEVSTLRVEMARLGADLRQEITLVRSDLRGEMATLGSDLRAEMATLGSDLRAEMAALGSDLRAEMAALGSNLRGEMATLGSDLRREIATVGSDVRQEIGNQKFDLLKWSFLFWIGQVVAMAGIVTLLLRTVGS